MADFLFTWTPSGWPHDELRRLVEDFTARRKSEDVWRCKAHRKARRGDHAYFLKLGTGEHGIFDVGEITGPASKDVHVVPGQNPWKVPIRFLRLVDPNETLLVSEQEYSPISKWHPQGSGIRLSENAARSIDELIAKRFGEFITADTADADAFDPSNLEDARERINRSIAVRRGQQAFRSMLLDAYDRKCAVTGCHIEDVLEAAHIVPYQGVRTNHIQNGILLRSDIHTLFDCGLIAVDPETAKIILSPRIMNSSYRQLAGRKIRRPKEARQRPSKQALLDHRNRCGL